jgi:O-antigen/teichoic acid export membrane protein
MTRRLFFSIADQAVVSAFNFALNLYLIRMALPEEFGVFAIVAAATLFAAMVQNALINTPLAVHLPIALDAEGRTRLQRTFTAANALLSLALLMGSGSVLALWLGDDQPLLAVSACFFLVSQFLREYYRSLLAVEGRLAALFSTDLASVVLATGSLATLHALGTANNTIVPAAFLCVGLAGVTSIAPAAFTSARMGAWRAVAADMRQVFRAQAHEIRWSLLGVITTEVQNRGYVYIAAVVFGPAVVAQLQAGRILFGPLNLLTNAWARVARPQLAGLLGRCDIAGFDRTLKRAMQAFASSNLVFLAALWLAWPTLSALVFSGKYANLGPLVAAWGIANVLFQCRSCLGVGVQALRRFRELTTATVAGGAVALALTGVACFAGKPAWLIGAVIAGESLALLVVIRILRHPAPIPAIAAG